ncbi:MAG: UvrD-helicase domain-containing protein, partial [Bdellovibrio sp.]
MSRTSNSFNLKGSLIVRAGAGAGKTTRLIERIAHGSVEFLENEGRWPKLVVTTFTRKATQELKERLLKHALAKGDLNFIRFVQSPSQLLVTTIHGLLVRFLREKAQVLGLSPRFQILSEFESDRIWYRCFRKLLTHPDCQDSLVNILEFIELPQLETILIQAVKLNEISGPLSPIPFAKQWEDLQKTHQEAQNLRKALRGELASLPKLSPSWKEFSQRLLNFESLLQEAEFRWPARNAQIPDEIGQGKDRLKEIVQVLRSPNSQARWMQAQEKVTAHILSLARNLQLLREASLLDLDALSQSELELWSLRLLTDFPIVAEDFCQRWDSWMIDEYQDTSPIQDRILDLLRAQKSLFIVGDPQQSLYLFRGARREVFEEKIRKSRKFDPLQTSEFEALAAATPGSDGDLHAEFLESFENYRTHPELARIVNQLIQNQGPFEALRARKNPSDTRDYRAQWIHRESSEKAARQSLLEWEVEQALRVALSLQSEGTRTGARKRARIGILARQNSEVRKLKARALEKGIPVVATSLAHLSAHPIVEEALRYLQFCIYPHDNINLACILRGAWWGDFATELTDWDRVNLWQSLKARQRGNLLEPMEELLKKAETQGVVESWREFIWNSPLLHRAQSADPSGQILGNLLKLLHQAWAKSREGLTPLLRWLDQSLHSSSDRPEAELAEAKAASSAGIEVMTIHASKGLEFDHVILLGCGQAYRPRPPHSLMKDPESSEIALALKWEESESSNPARLWPQRTEEWRQWQEDQERAEYARLFYVAVTRAESSLTLISSQIQKRSWAENFPPQFEQLSSLARRLSEFPDATPSNPTFTPQERAPTSEESCSDIKERKNTSLLSRKAIDVLATPQSPGG